MKGVVIHYDEKKGFGFIKDENEVDRFFHINSVHEKYEFFNNLSDYYYPGFDRKCFVLDFTPNVNDRGLVALNISLTDQIINDKSNKEAIHVKVTDFKYEVDSLTRITQHIKKGMSPPPFATAGGHGTYRLGYPEVTRELNIYFRRIDEIGWGTIEVRELALDVNERMKITESFVETIRNQLIEKIIIVKADGENWFLQDASILKI